MKVESDNVVENIVGVLKQAPWVFILEGREVVI